MTCLPLGERFEGFGPFRLALESAPPTTEIEVPRNRRDARRMVGRHATPVPGVYGMVDAAGQLIYVGKSKALRHRLVSYFTKGRDGKASVIVARTRRLIWEQAPHEFLALARELELIRRFRPRYNVKGCPGRFRRNYLCLARDPAAKIVVGPRPSPRESLLYGPVPAGRASQRVAALLNDCFGLRDCTRRVAMAFADQGALFAEEEAPRCLRHEMGNCLAPCAGRCTRRQYALRIRAARDFLCGQSRPILERLEAAMRQAAAEGHYERAAAWRDCWNAMCQLDEQLTELRECGARYRFIYPIRGYGRRQLWCLVDAGHVAATLPAPAGRRQARVCLEQLEQVFPPVAAQRDWQTTEDLDELFLVRAWFREHPEELSRVLLPEEARQQAAEVAGR